VIKLERDVVWCDIESTGLTDADKIVEVAIIRMSDRSVLIDTLVNPGIEIPENISAIHGITNEMVKNAPTFKDIAGAVYLSLTGADWAGHNVDGIDIPFIERELRAAGYKGLPPPDDRRFLCTKKLHAHFFPQTMEHLYKFYTGRTLEQTHRAADDVLRNIEMFEAMAARYELGDKTVAELTDLTQGEFLDRSRKFKRNEKGEIIFAFGKHGEDGRTLRWVLDKDPGFIRWMRQKNVCPELDKVINMLGREERNAADANLAKGPQ
jgi:DNA polymerase-3 subunit epsilon